LWDTVLQSGLGFVQEELERERTALRGERYAHQERRQAMRDPERARALLENLVQRLEFDHRFNNSP
jgi:hypothetical protein